jgi:tetratricopeptide (TPR) repeat protein
MKFIRILQLLSLAMLFSLFSYGQARDMQKEAAIWEQLRSKNPDLIDAFKQGTEDMDAGKYKLAISSYQKVVDGAPDFDPGLRRLGMCLAQSGEIGRAMIILEKAVGLNRSPENLASLAEFTAFPGSGGTAPREAQERALGLMREVAKKTSKPDAYDLYLTARISLAINDDMEFRNATQQLMDNFPQLAVSHYMNAIRATVDEKWVDAENEIRRAGQLGMPADAVRDFLDSGVHRQATIRRYAEYAVYTVAAWIIGLGLLFIFGKALSVLTLRSIEHSGTTAGTMTGTEKALRRVYRSLIVGAGWYYYVSLPFVAVLLLAVAGGVFYAFLALGRIPLQLIAILGIVTVGTIYKMVRCLFIKIKVDDPGRSLREDEAPGLWALAKEVGTSLGTRPIDEIRITVGTDVAVYEKGSKREKAQDKAKRILVLGLGVLDGFRIQPFRAVLAHEYGHFTHRDTAGGDVALRVNNEMMKFAYAIAGAGHAVWWNLGFQFVRIYHFLFRRISHGASRLQEVLADRTAALKYGANAFEEGLTHAVRRGIEFPTAANREIKLAVDGGRALNDLYGIQLNKEQPIEEEIRKALSAPSSEDDTHPSPADRFRLIRQLAAVPAASDTGMVWDLFANREALTREMTTLVDQSIHRSARAVPGAEPPTFREVNL